MILIKEYFHKTRLQTSGSDPESLDNACSQTTGQSSTVRLNVKFGDSSILHQHRESLAANVSKDGRQIQLQFESFGEISTGISQHPHLTLGCLILTPGFHHEGVIDGDTNNLLDSLSFKFSCRGHIAGKVGLAAALGEGSWHSEHDHLLPRAELGQVDLVARAVLKQVH